MAAAAAPPAESDGPVVVRLSEASVHSSPAVAASSAARVISSGGMYAARHVPVVIRQSSGQTPVFSAQNPVAGPAGSVFINSYTGAGCPQQLPMPATASTLPTAALAPASAARIPSRQSSTAGPAVFGNTSAPTAAPLSTAPPGTSQLTPVSRQASASGPPALTSSAAATPKIVVSMEGTAPAPAPAPATAPAPAPVPVTPVSAPPSIDSSLPTALSSARELEGIAAIEPADTVPVSDPPFTSNDENSLVAAPTLESVLAVSEAAAPMATPAPSTKSATTPASSPTAKRRPMVRTQAASLVSVGGGGTKNPKRPKRHLSDDSFDRRANKNDVGGAPGRGVEPSGTYSRGNSSGTLPRRPSNKAGGSVRLGSGSGVPSEVGTATSSPRVASKASEKDDVGSSKLGAELPLREGQTMTAMQSLEADIRCMASVAVGTDLSVWCGERDGSLAVRDAVTANVRVRIPQEKLEHDFVWVILQIDDNVWVGTSSGRVRIYSAANRHLQVQRIRHAGGIYALAALGKFVYSASNDFTILEWDRQTCDSTSKILSEHTNQVRCLCVCAGRLVSGSDDRTIRVWDVRRAESVHSFRHSDSVQALAYVPASRRPTGGDEGCLWAGDNSGAITVYDWRQRKKLHELREHTGPIFSIMRKHGLILSASADTTLKVFDPTTFKCLRSLSAHSSYVAAIAPVAREVRTRIWSASADKVLRSWSLRHRSIIDEGFERLQDESEHLLLLNKQVEEDAKAARASEQEKADQVAQLQGELERENQKMQQAERSHNEQAEELRTALKNQGEELSKARSELEESRNNNEKLQEELQALRQELAEAMAGKQAHADDLVSTTKQLEHTRSQLFDQQEAGVRLEADLQETENSKQSLQQQLEEVQTSLGNLDKERQSLQAQVDEHAPFKQSRLALVTEICNMHKRLTDARKHVHVVAKVHMPKVNPGAKVSVFKTDADEALDHVKRAREHATTVITKYLTDDEKLHLGIPLSQLEVDRRGARSPDWDEACSEITERSITSVRTADKSGRGTSSTTESASRVQALASQALGREAANSDSGAVLSENGELEATSVQEPEDMDAAEAGAASMDALDAVEVVDPASVSPSKLEESVVSAVLEEAVPAASLDLGQAVTTAAADAPSPTTDAAPASSPASKAAASPVASGSRIQRRGTASRRAAFGSSSPRQALHR